MSKLLVASGIFHPESGGPATYLKAILPALQAKGWQPRVLTFGDSRQRDYPYPVTRITRQFYPVRQARYALAAARQLAWADITFAQTIDLPIRGRPRVIKIVGDQAWERCLRRGWIPPDMSIDSFQTYRGDARVRWQKRSRTQQVTAMDAVIVPSQYLKGLVTAWGVDAAKVEVITNALPLPRAPAQPRHAVRAGLRWTDQPTLVTVARLQPWKGIDHVISVMRGLPDLRLIVVGDGPDRGRLQEMALPLGDRVQFTGQLPQAQVLRLLYAADGLVLYSGYEGLSHTILESLQLGTPVLCSDLGGNPELVRPGVNGILVPHINIAALSEGIKQLVRQREYLSANSSQGLERFKFDTMVRRTDALLQSQLP